MIDHLPDPRNPRFKCFLLLAFTALLWVSRSPTSALEKAKAKEPPSVRNLINQLANGNRKPGHEGAKARPIWPPEYDWKEQERIERVWKRLHARAGEDLGELFDHINDKRYCLTLESPSGAWNDWDVGDLCYHILRVNIEPYQRPGDRRFDRFIPHPRSQDPSLGEWWQPRSDKSLLDLQLEAISHAETSTTRWLEKTEDEEERQKYRADLAHLVKLREKIEETEEPIRVVVIAREELGFYWPEAER